MGQQTRSFKNRFGYSIYEEILRFKIENLTMKNVTKEAYEIGLQALTDALIYCNSDVKSDIKMAIEKAESIKTSPLYT